jgi:hypothetical protein
MRRHLKGMFFSILAAKLGRLLHRRGHSTAARYLEHELHRRAGHGRGQGHGQGYGQGYGQAYGPGNGHYGYHGHYRSKSGYGHYGYHGHYKPKKKRRRYW